MTNNKHKGKIKYGNPVYRNMSGKNHKNDFSGQLCLKIDENNNPTLVEERQIEKRICTPYESIRYWMALKEFLDLSGKFARVYHLYETVRKDPSDYEINQIPDQVRREEVRKAVQERKAIMLSSYHVKDIRSLGYTKERRYNEYLKSLTELLEAAEAAHVNPHMKKDEMDAFLYRFVLLDDSTMGACRRDFYRERYLRKAAKEIKKEPFTAYVAPISIRDMEAAFAKADDFKERFRISKENDKKRDRKGRAKRH